MKEEFVLKTRLIGGVFITDPHITASSNVRSDEDYTGTILNKIKFCIESANEWGVPLFMGGDVFDKPTIPDVVKNRLVEVLKLSKYGVFTCTGNHTTLFNNPDNDPKTSLYLFNQLGLIRYWREGGFYWEDAQGNQVYVNFSRPMGKKDCPQLGLYHGFLNTDHDKDNYFLFTDIDHDDPSLIFLGHDHVPYEPIEYSNSVIHRPGALVRAIRNDSEDRIPQMVRFQLKVDGTSRRWITKYYDVPCATSNLIFKTKKAKIQQNPENNYSNIIEQIKAASNDDLTLVKALELVAPAEIVSYVEHTLEEISNIRASK